MSNVVQIMLMPLIMVGQNLRSRHSETRAEQDFETNQRAEKEVTAAILHLQWSTGLLLRLMHHLERRVSGDELQAIVAQRHRDLRIGSQTSDARE